MPDSHLAPDHCTAALRRFTRLVAGATLLLVFVGAMVTSTGSGLAVPDWPLSFGRLMPPMVAGVLYEHGHRLLAALVGSLTVAQAVWLQRREPRRFLRMLGWCAVGMLGVQALLGGTTVLLRLPPAVSIAHAAVAELFLCLNVAIAFFVSAAGRTEVSDPALTLRILAAALTLALYLQILLGAVVRHFDAAAAIPDFPLSFGHVVPPAWGFTVTIDFAHRLGALLVVVLALALLAVAVVHSAWRLAAAALCTLIGLQLALGVAVVRLAAGAAGDYHALAGAQAVPHAAVVSAHVVTGAACLAGSLLLTIAVWTARRNLRLAGVPSGAWA